MSTDTLGGLFDASIDQLSDLPEFKHFPAGIHSAVVTFSSRETEDNAYIDVKLVAKESLELSDPAKDAPLVQGEETQVSYQLGNDFGQGSLKNLAKKFLVAQGIEDPAATMNQAFGPYQGAELIFVTKVREGKKDNKGKFYTIIDDVIFDASLLNPTPVTAAPTVAV